MKRLFFMFLVRARQRDLAICLRGMKSGNIRPYWRGAVQRAFAGLKRVLFYSSHCLDYCEDCDDRQSERQNDHEGCDGVRPSSDKAPAQGFGESDVQVADLAAGFGFDAVTFHSAVLP